MIKSKKEKPPFIGKWQINEMELWDKEHLDLVEKAYIRFDEDATGEFKFIAVHGFINWVLEERQGKAAVEFSWDGDDDMMSVSGRGWAILSEPNQIDGKIYFHNGDNSEFKATKISSTAKKKQPRVARIITKDGVKKIEF